MCTRLRSRTWAYLALTVVAGLLAGAGLGYGAGLARAATPTNLGILNVQDDRFYNYDFNSPTESYNGADWPFNLIFWNDAAVEKVKNSTVGGGFVWSGATQYARMNDGSESGGQWFSDDDQGRKTALCPSFASAWHYRLYARPGSAPSGRDGDRMYNIEYGYYVLGTSHRDQDECGGPNQATGWSEDAEGVVTNTASSSWKNQNCCNYLNSQYGWEGTHYWQSNGYATSIRVP